MPVSGNTSLGILNPSLLLTCFEGLLINDLSSFIGFLMERGYIFWKIKRKLLEFLEASADRNSRFSWYRTIV